MATSYVTTGEYRHTSLLVTRTVQGQSTNTVYSLLEAFPAPALGEAGFAALTAQQFQRLPALDYALRLDHFLRHIETQEPGFDRANDIENPAAGVSAQDGVLACVDNR